MPVAIKPPIAIEVAAHPGKMLTLKATAAKAAAHMGAAESAAHMGTATTSETSAVSPHPPPTSPTARKRLGRQAPGENCSRSQNDQGLS
jgi:hypothetical protein